MRVAATLGIWLGILLSGCLASDPAPPAPDPASSPEDPAGDDVVVVAVVDSGFNPYHWDFAATKMPQQLDDDPGNDLPLFDDPASWLPGHPGAVAFASYGALNLTLDGTEAEALSDSLYDKDRAAWDKMETSTSGSVHMKWVPGTKVVGYVKFAGGDGFAPGSHGVGTTGVSVGNLHGSCPECLLVFVHGTSEVANEWVASQPWIDLQTNSWGLSLLVRDRLYAKSDTQAQRAAIERGQSIFFSAGNGQENAFTVPNPTLWSSQEGPDWIVTVGAIAPGDGSSYSGHGKPADVAHLGSQYPSSGGTTVNGTQSFGGTSNATPAIAGTYARALHLLRREMAEASRVQANGTVSVGAARCGAANQECALADGILTIDELREALFRSAEYTEAGWSVSSAAVPVPAGTQETEFVAEGHGSFWGRLRDDGAWWLDSERVQGYANGTWSEPQSEEQRQWMVADSYCRQALWGAWDHGYWREGGALPSLDPAMRPARTWLLEECPSRGKAVLDVVRVVNG